MVDSHAHLNDEKLAPDFLNIVREANEVGVHTIINVGCNYEDSVLAIRQSEQSDSLYACVGLHPHTANEGTDDYLAKFFELAKNDKVKAYGEIGLDYHYDFSPREKQKEVFAEQIRLAHELSLPIVLHLREAFLDANNILSDSRKYLTDGVLVHCYSGSKELTQFYNSLGCYYSFGGILTFAKHKQEILKEIPLSRLLLETDCPYMTPVPKRGETNYPKYIPLVLAKMSELLEMEKHKLEEITDANAKNFYRY